MKHIILITLLTLIFFEPILSDIVLPKGPTSYSSRGDRYIAEIFTINSRLKNDKPFCFFYKINQQITYENYDHKKKFELVWSGELSNNIEPNAAILSNNGYLITLDETTSKGYFHSLVLYDKQGKLIKDYSLDELIPESDIYDFPTTVGSKYWRDKASYFFCNIADKTEDFYNPTHFYIVLTNHKVLELVLDNGNIKYGDLKDFPNLFDILKQKYIADIAIIYENRLENSSITEILKCLNSK